MSRQRDPASTPPQPPCLPAAIPPAQQRLSRLAGTARLLLALAAQALSQGSDQAARDPAAGTPAARGSRAFTHALHRRGPGGYWQWLALAAATISAPAFLLVVGLLSIDPHCDHPLFWWSLPAIVAAGNAIAIISVHRLHRRQPFIAYRTLARHHAVIGSAAAAALFLGIGWVSGFLPDIATAVTEAHPLRFPMLVMALSSVVLAGGFGALSCAHAGALHAWLCFRMPEPGPGRTLPA